MIPTADREKGDDETEQLLSASTIAAMDERSNRRLGNLVQKMAQRGREFYED